MWYWGAALALFASPLPVFLVQEQPIVGASVLIPATFLLVGRFWVRRHDLLLSLRDALTGTSAQEVVWRTPGARSRTVSGGDS